MARPPKTNADYFPHDGHMRNDPRVLALRRKHGIEGYAVYVMLVEALCTASHFRLDVSKMGQEILSGDFGIDQKEFSSIVDYCVQIDLFQRENDVLTCKSLNNRLVSLINRRVIDDINPAETIQKQDSKVKESKVKETKDIEGTICLGNPDSNTCFKILGQYAYDKNYIVYGEDGYRQMITDVLKLPESTIDKGHLRKFLLAKNGTVFEGSPSFVINSFKKFVSNQFK